jgi:hypothetical protein
MNPGKPVIPNVIQRAIRGHSHLGYHSIELLGSPLNEAFPVNIHVSQKPKESLINR